VRVFTSVNVNYLDRALILQESVKKFNPDWIFTLFLVDEIPKDAEAEEYLKEFDQVVLVKNLNIPNFENWIRGFSVVEACTAIKGFALEFILGYGDDAIYLDPDIVVFNNLDIIQVLLESNNIIVTPHILDSETDKIAIIDNEINALKHGIFNLGFLAVKCSPEGLKFANWWASRLYDFCVEDFDKGLFVDQKWIDLVPVLFNDVLVWKDKGANLASWNISRRTLEFDADSFLVDGSPLLFLHFSKARSFGPPMTMRYGYENLVLTHLWRWYIQKLNSNSNQFIVNHIWAYS
jgi:hypothetical protein